MLSSMDGLLKSVEGNTQTLQDRANELYGKRIAYAEIQEMFPSNIIVYTDALPESADIKMEERTIVPWYIGEHGEDVSTKTSEAIKKGRYVGVAITGEESIVYLTTSMS